LTTIFPEQDFLSFAKNLNAYLKSKEVTSFFTAATSSLMSIPSLTESNISTFTDNIVMLRYVEMQGQLSTVINIVKVRGSPHDNNLRKYEVSSEGVGIGSSLTGYEGIITGVTRKVSKTIEEMLDLEFKRFIGPMGAEEFRIFSKGGVSKTKLLNYIDNLVTEGILRSDAANNFKKRIAIILDAEKGGIKSEKISQFFETEEKEIIHGRTFELKRR